MENRPAQFLDVPTLLRRSQPRPRPAWLLYGLGSFVLLAILSGIGGSHPTARQFTIQLLSTALMVAVMTATAVALWVSLRRYRAEQQALRAAEELIQLRRWQEAAAMLDRLLARPMRSQAGRVQGLIYLAGVLTRYHRFTDALAVHEYLIEHVRLDPAGDYGLRLGRAMAMLREDHLLDADRAIGQLRKLASGQQGAGGLALVEIYRDVKTGHAAEAVEIFGRRLAAIRDQLGHRVADAYALAARAYDMLGQAEAAASAWADATILAPAGELVRRYPEVEPVAARYAASVGPMAAGGSGVAA
jgi:tetratricopeptide (TPR) repeat protein